MAQRLGLRPKHAHTLERQDQAGDKRTGAITLSSPGTFLQHQSIPITSLYHTYEQDTMPPTAEYKAPWPVFALAWSNHPSTSSSPSSSHPRNPSGSARYIPPSPSPLGRQDEF